MRLPRVRFSVRVLMALVLGLGGWLGWVVHCARVQRDAMAAVRRGGGVALYDWQSGWFEGLVSPGAGPNAPRWLVDCLGPDYFSRVTEVYLGPREPDAVMPWVGCLPHVEVM